MTPAPTTGADLLCATLKRLGAEQVFGLPGTQNVPLFEALRRSRLRTLVATSELAASFMANGYYRASGRLPVLVTIPGPGFTYALSGLAEACLDSAAMLYVVGQPAESPGHRFQLQRIDQRAMATPIVKGVFDVEEAADLPSTLATAARLALAGEPGPVVVQVGAEVLTDTAPASAPVTDAAPAEPDPTRVDRVARLLADAPRVLIYAGQGTHGAATELRALAEGLQAPVATTTTARGVLPEDHALSIPLGLGRSASDVLNGLVRAADVVVVLGCKFSHNGALGFRLELDPEKLVHIDASAETLGSNYPAGLTVQCDVPAFLRALGKQRGVLEGRVAGWPAAELDEARRKLRERLSRGGAEPAIRGVEPPTARELFSLLRRVLPRDACLVTDSGLHQILARRYYSVLGPRGLLVPTNFQSMGFGLPAAIGARLADPTRPVVAVVGDGGLAMSGFELLTAARGGLSLTVIVFNDGHLGQIRLQQLEEYGRTHGTSLQSPDYAQLAESLGAGHVRLEGDAERVLREVLQAPGVNVVEVVVGDSVAIHSMRARRLAAGAARSILPRSLTAWLKRQLRRGR